MSCKSSFSEKKINFLFFIVANFLASCSDASQEVKMVDPATQCLKNFRLELKDPESGRVVKFENNEDGKYSQAMIAPIIKHFHLPNNTVVTDEDVDAILLRSVDGGDGIYGGDVVSIWKYYKKQNDIQEIVTAHPMADLLWYNPDKKHGVTIGLDSVFVASEAMLVPLNPDVVVVNGTTDKMNTIYTFILDKDAGKAILLPSNRGCVGFTSEDGLPICQSCRHYSDTRFGRYSVVSVYDLDGKLVKEMSFEDYKKDEK